LPAHKISSLIMMFLVFAITLVAKAEDSPQALSFKAWKEQQVLSAQNRLLRVSVELDQLKESHEPKESKDKEATSKEKALERFQKTQVKSELTRATKELAMAKQAVESASDLTLDDYVTIYLPTLSQAPEAIEALVGSMTKEELAQVFSEILKRQSDQRDRSTSSSPKLSGFWAKRDSGND